MTYTFKVTVQESQLFRLTHSTIVFIKSFNIQLVCPTYCILQFAACQVITFIKSVDFQVKTDMFTTEKRVPFTDEETVDAVHKWEQNLHLLALLLEILGYIPLLLNGLVYFRRIGDFRGESLILRLFLNILVLPAPLKLTEAAENKFMGLTNTDGNIVLKLLMEWGTVQKKQNVT